ncbi:helix-turn-helix domain-containing protein [Planotetraspora phitsanulokensis]|uniref:MerR family transcriptional regulator n=1 Tax=Planotetraspora phitsanulokensis TaxID=575192 RepID=A0A8J3XD01_9ACTN|nr:helix-turn-helix domain-containing protein [Planotetraspora phitsanulokensis]GII36727.1 MerR family transcriptional regulator [Planotetraspora phitsanulokensis]
MSDQLYSVDQVADLLGLHVKTVRGYVRDGRLKAVRIGGRQYRIARDDLEAFTGHPVATPAREDAPRHRRTEVTGIVQIDAVDPTTMNRLSTMITAAVAHPHDGERLHIEIVYDEERAGMKIIIVGGLDTTADLLKIINVIADERP